MRFALGLALSLCAFLLGCGGDSEPVRGDLLLTADRLFDGRRMVEDGAVVITGQKIVAVGSDLDAEAKRRIDLGDATLLPGFIDLHVHQAGGEGSALSRGVTTVRDLGAPSTILPVASPQPGSLRVLAAGPIVTVPNGYPTPVHGRYIALPFRGSAGARKAVAFLADREAVIVKIALEPGFSNTYPMPSRVEVGAIVREAHRRGLRVTAHVSEGRGTRLALETGVDELAHMPCYATEPELLRRLAREGVPIVGTLHITSVFRCPDVGRNARIFVSAGGKLFYGSDYGNPGIPVGIDVEELKLMTSAGLTPAEAIAAATAAAGELLGMQPLGTLVAGAPADVIGVRGNPLSNLERLQDPALVVAGGRVVVAP
jgi:imidazolonepropionase-like amidohydrolase